MKLPLNTSDISTLKQLIERYDAAETKAEAKVSGTGIIELVGQYLFCSPKELTQVCDSTYSRICDSAYARAYSIVSEFEHRRAMCKEVLHKEGLSTRQKATTLHYLLYSKLPTNVSDLLVEDLTVIACITYGLFDDMQFTVQPTVPPTVKPDVTRYQSLKLYSPRALSCEFLNELCSLEKCGQHCKIVAAVLGSGIVASNLVIVRCILYARRIRKISNIDSSAAYRDVFADGCLNDVYTVDGCINATVIDTILERTGCRDATENGVVMAIMSIIMNRY